MKRLPLLLAIALYFGGSLLWLGANRDESGTFPGDSVLDTSDDGASVVYRYFLARHPGGATLLTHESLASTLPANAVVFRIAPFWNPAVETDEDDEAPDPKITKGREKSPTKTTPTKPARLMTVAHKDTAPLLNPDEDEFVRNGGRIVIAIRQDHGPAHVVSTAVKKAVKSFPIWPGLDSVALPAPRGIAPTLLERGYALYIAGSATVIERIPLGRGDVLLSAEPELFENDFINRPGALAMALAMAPAGRPVYFDELSHGMTDERGMTSILTDWGLGPMLLCIAAVVTLLLWRGITRLGPHDEDRKPVASDAVDLVHSIGSMYARTLSNQEAIALYHRALVRAVAAKTGLRGEALQQRATLLAQNVSIPEPPTSIDAREFATLLDTINEAFRRLEHA